ncbi:Hypothetical predicted protein [Olea europaea subsp. europaea]|uniref:Uncharacterized protein n=1 Tax=Olea europaea subsp. europaea TaxID=158383 RepID=A0A8S0U9G4_OLEEU|nr:Hypothetical predicted protein [Olea europaea subsp. europaea]
MVGVAAECDDDTMGVAPKLWVQSTAIGFKVFRLLDPHGVVWTIEGGNCIWELISPIGGVGVAVAVALAAPIGAAVAAAPPPEEKKVLVSFFY